MSLCCSGHDFQEMKRCGEVVLPMCFRGTNSGDGGPHLFNSLGRYCGEAVGAGLLKIKRKLQPNLQCPNGVTSCPNHQCPATFAI